LSLQFTTECLGGFALAAELATELTDILARVRSTRAATLCAAAAELVAR
jgi:hypothetical protein